MRDRRAMNIAVVAYEMEGDSTGVGRYLQGLLDGISQCPGDESWTLFFKGDPFEHPLWCTSRSSGPRFDVVFDSRPDARPILWEQLRLPRLIRASRPDYVFSPAYSLPPRVGAPGIVTVHDLSFEVLGHEFPRRERWRRRLLARQAVRRARRVITDTRDIARDLIRTYGISYGKVAVIPLGIEPRFFVDDSPSDNAPGGLDAYDIRPPFLLYLGSILERRHVDLVIQAFSEIAGEHPELTLVLAGRNRLRNPQHLDDWLRACPHAERIRVVGYFAESDLLALYRNAELTYYLSSYEGYGLPPLESLAAGTPPIVSRGLALDELWPDYPFRVLTLDTRSVISTTRSALADDALRRAVAHQGVERMKRLDWRKSAELFLEELRGL